MAETEDHSHESAIKTPKQLVTVVVLAFVVPIIVIVMLVTYVTSGVRVAHDNDALSPEAVAARIAPVANVAIGEPEVAKGERSGEQVVKSACQACHGTGVAGAPKIGDKTAWGSRIAHGLKDLLANAMKGTTKGMPPRGGDSSLTDEELERAIVFMANQAGGNFKEPPAPKPADTPDNK